VSAITIAVDVMGGDFAPRAIVDGAVLAARELGARIALVGDAASVRHALHEHPDVRDLPVTIIDAPDAIAMGESPLAALRRKPGASIKVACELVARGEANAVVTAGHTGAALLAAHHVFGLLDGIDRPALAVTLPTISGSTVLVDAGANVECRAEHLRQFGVLGAAYARDVLGVANPRVGLLSIGEEAGKGTDLVREAHDLLTSAPVAFIGNVDAHALFTGAADVVVCDGFTGNVVLKVGEGLVEAMETWLRRSFETSPGAAAPSVGDGFLRFKQIVDYAERGAAPLLGIAGLVLVGHGRSTPVAVRNAIATAIRFARSRPGISPVARRHSS